MSDDRKPMANIAPFGLRMQPELKARAEAAARNNNRSLNSEIVSRLQESFDREEAAAALDALSPFDSVSETQFDRDAAEAISKALRDVMRSHGIGGRTFTRDGEIIDEKE